MRQQRYQKILILLILLVLVTTGGHVIPCPADEGQTLVMGFLQPPEHPVHQWLKRVYTEAFAQLGITLEVRYYPARRLSMMANRGDVDGELGRISSYGEGFPNLIRIGVPHWETKFFAYAFRPGLVIDSWDTLRQKSYHVAYGRGIVFLENNVRHYVPPESQTALRTAEQGLLMLIKNRTDLLLYPEEGVGKLLNDKMYSKIYIAGQLDSVTAHAFLHKKHTALVKPLEDILRNMADAGTILEYKQQAEQAATDTP